MDIDLIELGGGASVVKLGGKLNMVSARAFRDAVTEAVSAGQNRLAIDLTDVDFIDSSGLGALISGLKTTRQAGGDLRIASPNEQVRLVLQLTNMERLLTAYSDATTAFADA